MDTMTQEQKNLTEAEQRNPVATEQIPSKNHPDGGLLKRNAPMRELAEAHEGRFFFWDILFTVAFALLPEIVFSLLLSLILGIIMGISGNISALTSLQGNNDLAMLLNLALTVPVLITVLLFWRFVGKKKLSSMGFVKKGAALSYLKGFLLGFLLLFAAWFLAVLTGSADFVFTGISSGVLPLYLCFLIGFLIQGMEEEVICRGYLMNNMSLRYPVIAGIIVNAVLFSAGHLLNPGISALPIINLALFGIFASLYYYHTENLWGIGAFHSMWNFSQGNIFGVLVSGGDTGPTLIETTMISGRELFNGGDFGLEGGLFVTILYTVGIIVLIILIRNKAHKAETR